MSRIRPFDLLGLALLLFVTFCIGAIVGEIGERKKRIAETRTYQVDLDQCETRLKRKLRARFISVENATVKK